MRRRKSLLVIEIIVVIRCIVLSVLKERRRGFEYFLRIKVTKKVAQQIELAGEFWCRKHPLLMVGVGEIGRPLLRWREVPVGEAQNYKSSDSPRGQQ